jgi:hypothetical protein
LGVQRVIGPRCGGVMVALLAACAPAMLRPAHSLARLQGAGNIALMVDPAYDRDAEFAGCLAEGGCDAPANSPIDIEYRIGLGRGFELGLRGLFPPRVLDLKYSLLDERRHGGALSVALHAEAGAAVALEVTPIARGDVLVSGTLPLADGVALRPAASAGWWLQQDRLGELGQGFGWTGGLFVPFRIPAEGGVSPYLGASGFLPVDGQAEWMIRGGILFEPWLAFTGPDHGSDDPTQR